MTLTADSSQRRATIERDLPVSTLNKPGGKPALSASSASASAELFGFAEIEPVTDAAAVVDAHDEIAAAEIVPEHFFPSERRAPDGIYLGSRAAVGMDKER